MNQKEQNKLLSKWVINKIPRNINVRDYLVKKLEISRESAYRRMRGQVPFTFEEVSTLALEFEFSLDEIARKIGYIGISIISDGLANSEPSFCAVLQEFSDYIGDISTIPKAEVLFSMNHIDMFFLVEQDLLFRLFYYKWEQQVNPVAFQHRPFSEVVIPAEVMEIRKQLRERIKRLKNMHFILHKDLFQTMIKEIQYFYNRKLIVEEEIHLLEKELILLLQDLKYKMQQRIGENGEVSNFYLSLLNVENNSICAGSAHNWVSFYWLFPSKTFTIKQSEHCREHLSGLEYLRRCSMQISRSNEILQMEFIERQSNIIGNVNQRLSYYQIT